MSQSNQLALSLAETMEAVAGQPDEALAAVWPRILAVEPNSPDLYLALTVIYGKFSELRGRIGDSSLPDRAKGLYDNAAAQLTQFVNPSTFQQFSAGTVKKHQDKIDLLHLASASLPGGLVADVQQVTLDQLCAELEEIRASLATADIDPEARRLIETSLGTLLMVLRSYKVFGPEGAARIYGSVAAELSRNLQTVAPKSEAEKTLLQRAVDFTKKVGAVVIWTSALAGGAENLITDGSDIAALLTGSAASPEVSAKPKKGG